MSSNLLGELVAEYYGSRPNLTVDHAPLCVFFFACSGAGKSTIRRLLVEKLQATYVCNDEVRELLQQHPDAIAQGIELKAVVASTIEKIFAEASNKLVIFDNNIIQYYMYEDSYINVAKKQHRPIFIIGLEATEGELVARIQQRGVHVDQLLGELPEQLRAYQHATSDIRPDWTVRITDSPEELSEMIALIQNKTQLTPGSRAEGKQA